MPGVLKGVQYDDPLVRYRGEKVVSILRRVSNGKVDADPDLAIDTFYSLYLPHPILKQVDEIPIGKELNYAIMSELLRSNDFKSVKLMTIANSSISTVLSVSLLHHVLTKLQSRGGSEEGGEGEWASSKYLRRKVGKHEVERAVRKALEAIKDEGEVVKELEKIATGYKAGVGSVLSFEEFAEDVINLARNTDIKRLIELLQWLPDWVPRLRRKVTRYPKGELCGYELGSDIERLVPTELSYPSIYIYTKLSDGKLLLYEKVLPQSFGPLYVLLDKSGSMEGEKIRWAKATALALYVRARKESRPFYIRFFDSLPHELIKVSIKVKPREFLNLMELIAKVKSGGGTDITRAIVTACEDIFETRTKGVSDIILITDGEDRVSEAVITRRLRAANARLITVMVMGENIDLRRLSDKYMRVVRLSTKESLQVIEA